MVSNNRDWDIKLNDGTDTRRFRLLRTKDGLAWRVSEQPVTPRVEDNAAALSFESLPAERMLSFAMDNWSWGVGLNEFVAGATDVGSRARLWKGFNVDVTTPNRIRHGPERQVVGTLLATPIQYIFFDSKVYIITASHLYSYNGTSLVLETTQSGFVRGAAVFAGKLYVPRGPGTVYSTWDGSSFVTAPTPTDPGGASKKIIQFAVVGNRLWAAHDDNRVSFINETSTDWEKGSLTAGIRVGDGGSITNLFSISGLLFIATESSIFVQDNDFVSHDLAKHFKTSPSVTNFNHLAESGGEAYISNGYNENLLRITASDFETFVIQEASPMLDLARRPVNADRKDIASSLFGVGLDQKHIILRASLTDGSWVYKGTERGGGVISWSPLQKMSQSAAGQPIGVFKTSGDDAMYCYIADSAGLTSLHRVPIDRWPNTHVDYASTWEAVTPFFNANLPTWDKVWWRLKVIAEKVGAGVGAVLTIKARIDDDAGTTTIGTVGNTDASGEYTFALPNTFAGRRVQLFFSGTSGNADQDGVDLIAFSLEGIIKPEYLPVTDFTVVATNKAEADFIKGLRTKTVAITLTDRFDADKSVFVIPGTPVELELIDEVLHNPVRAYRILVQETPPTS